MPDDATLARAREVIREWAPEWDAALHVSSRVGLESKERLQETIAAALRAYGDERERQAWEEAFKVHCSRCRNGEPVTLDARYAYTEGPPPYGHLVKGGAMHGEDRWDRCYATHLRARADALRSRGRVGAPSMIPKAGQTS